MTYAVGGMTCGGCARSVTQAIERAIPGVRVEVDVASGRVTVRGPHDAAAVQASVEAAGFAWGGPG